MSARRPRRAVEIYARFRPFKIWAYKGGAARSNYPGGYFVHVFEQGGGRIMGNPDGSITLQPHKGRRLWGLYPVRRAGEPPA